jgi:hypothetical protein
VLSDYMRLLPALRVMENVDVFGGVVVIADFRTLTGAKVEPVRRAS